MSDVFLLGAGFSKAISYQMPLLQELSNQVRDTMPGLNSPHSTLSNNIELWLSYLSQPHPWLREQDNLRNRAVVLDISQRIKAILGTSERAVIQHHCPPWLRKLTEHWHQHRSSVITLNYDTLVERAAGESEAGGDRLAYAEQLYPISLTLSTRRSHAVWGVGRTETFKLLKLHGSINWYYSGTTNTTGEVIYYSGIFGWSNKLDGEVESERHVDDQVPLIVPPTTDKSEFFRHESMKHLWSQATLSISSCSRIYIVGYSLPVTDVALRLFLIHSGSLGTSRKELYVVNPDDTVVSRYQDLLGSTFDIKDDYIGCRSVERFVEDACRDTNGNEE